MCATFINIENVSRETLCTPSSSLYFKCEMYVCRFLGCEVEQQLTEMSLFCLDKYMVNKNSSKQLQQVSF